MSVRMSSPRSWFVLAWKGRTRSSLGRRELVSSRPTVTGFFFFFLMDPPPPNSSPFPHPPPFRILYFCRGAGPQHARPPIWSPGFRHPSCPLSFPPLVGSSPQSGGNCAMRMLVLGAGLQGSARSEEHTSELQSQSNLVCRLLLEKKK